MTSSGDNPTTEPGERRREPQSLGYQRPTPAGLPRNPFNPGIFTPEKVHSTSRQIAQNYPGAALFASSIAPQLRSEGAWASRSVDQAHSTGIYRPISWDKVRLVRIHSSRSGGTDARIECTLQQHSINELPSYVALSYAWGDRRERATIVVNEQMISVTASLRDALVSLRRPNRDVVVWADALSINQLDVKELNAQIRIMARIYSAARSVVIWLGPASDAENTELAFMSMRCLSNSDSWHDDQSSQVKAIIDSKSAMEAIVCLFEKPYWKRLWVMQEIFYAQHVWVQCGKYSMPWDALTRVVDLLNEPCWKGEINQKYPSGHTLSRTSKTHYSYAQVLATQGPKAVLGPPVERPNAAHVSAIVDEATLPSPLAVMRICRSKLAARPQDKILGILNLLSNDINDKIAVGFHSTPNEIYTEIVSAIISATQSLDIICEAIYYPFRQDTFNLPSWVPDWSYAPDAPSMAAVSLYHRKAFAAAGEASRHTKPHPPRNDLVINAVVLGTVSQRGMAVGTLGRLTNYLMAFLEWRHILLDECGDNCSTGPEAFCRTLCVGDVPSIVDFGAERRYVNGREWTELSYHLWANFFNKRLPRIPLDEELTKRASMDFNIEESVGRRLIQQYYGSRMMGRCFCFIKDKGELHMGMGTGYMAIGDLVVVAHGCSVPIIIRPIGHEGKYQFVGDIYVDGFMDGEALKSSTSRELGDYILC